MPVPTVTTEVKIPPAPATDPTQEYVATGAWGWLQAVIRTLPAYIDDLTRDFGTDLYARMQRDPQISSLLRILKTAVLAAPLTVGLPNGLDADHPDYTPAETVRAFCAANLARLNPPLTQTLFALLDALAEGHKIAEQVYERTAPDPGVRAQLWLKMIKPKPSQALMLVEDPYTNLLGYLYAKPGTPTPVLSGLVKDDGSFPDNFLPRDRAVHLSFEPPDNDQRGTSLLRSVYRAWWMKEQTWPAYLAYLATFAQPSLWGTTAPAASGGTAGGMVQIKDDQGKVVRTISAQQAMLEQLMGIRNGGVGAGPHGSDAKILQVNSNGEAFEKAITINNGEIATGILGTTRATQEAQFGSRADSDQAQDVVGLLIAYIRGLICALIRNDILVPLIRLNFGDAALRFLPTVTIGNTEQQDFAANANAVAQLQKAGYLHWSQKPGIDAWLNLPPADEEAMAEEREQNAALKARLADSPPTDPNADPNAEEADGADTPPPPAKSKTPPKQAPPKPKGAPPNG